MRNPFAATMFGLAAGASLEAEPAARMRADVRADRGAGAQWLRFDIDWSQVERRRGHQDWGAVDRLVRAAVGCGMRPLGLIAYTPVWAAPDNASTHHAPPPAEFARFAAAAVRHLGPLGVRTYEIWNEPNNADFWRPRPDPAAYAALLRATYPAVKAADPGATVLTGGTAPEPADGLNVPAPDFLAAVYASGGGGAFDAVAVHPYCWPILPGAPVPSGWYQVYGTPDSVRGVMITHGDAGKRIWGTEFGAPTAGPRGEVVTEAQQAQQIQRAYSLWAGYPWAGPLFVYQGRDEGTDPANLQDFFGLLRHDGTAKPAYGALLQVHAAVDRARGLS